MKIGNKEGERGVELIQLSKENLGIAYEKLTIGIKNCEEQKKRNAAIINDIQQKNIVIEKQIEEANKLKDILTTALKSQAH